MATDNHSSKRTEFHKNLQTDEFGNKFFIDKKGRKMIYADTVSKEDLRETLLDGTVKAEMRKRHPLWF